MNGIFRFEYEGKKVLGINTGLSAEAFARARLAHLVTDPGYLVSLRNSSEPAVELWRAGGTVELAADGRAGPQKPVMVVWGPDFAASAGHDALSLGEIITRGGGPGSGNVLGALAAWVRARAALPAESRLPPWPGAALVDEDAETVFFLPEAAARRVFDSGDEGTWIDGAERWTHPDYSGEEADVFTAAALLYFALSGSFPYPCRDRDVLREDIREGFFIPPRLAAPGLLDEPASLISASLSPRAKLKGPRPALTDLVRLTGTAAVSSAAAGPDGKRGLFRSLAPAEKEALEAERERFLRKREKAVKTSRFLRRNRTAVLAVAGAFIIAALVAGSLIQTQLDRPSTRGMDPAAVVESYYNAINVLDHEMLEACVTGGAGKDDINMVTNLYVISRVRQAYEAREIFISPEEWRESGGGISEKAVFGISDLKIRKTDTDGGSPAVYRAGYLFFNPYPDSDGAAIGTANDGTVTPSAETEEAPPSAPAGVPRLDELVLEKDKKGLWHITEIRRTTISPQTID
jgi:hypothetical protein